MNTIDIKNMGKFKVYIFKISKQIVTPCSVVVGYQRFRGPCCLHLLPCDAV